MTGNKKLHFQALIRTGYVKKGGTAYVKRNFNHPMYRSGLYEPDIYSHDFCPVCVKFRPKKPWTRRRRNTYLLCLVLISLFLLRIFCEKFIFTPVNYPRFTDSGLFPLIRAIFYPGI